MMSLCQICDAEGLLTQVDSSSQARTCSFTEEASSAAAAGPTGRLPECTVPNMLLIASSTTRSSASL